MMSADAWNEFSKLMWTQWSVAMHAQRHWVVQLHRQATSLISSGFRPMIWTAITRVAAPYQQGSTAMNTQTIFRSDTVAGGVQQARIAPEFRVLPTTSIELDVICYWITAVALPHSLTHSVTHSLTHSFAHYMDQSRSWEANRFSASQEIPHILWNPKVHYRVYKYSYPEPVLPYDII